MELRGTVALVTGAATGVGRATAVELARRGCDIAVNYSRSEDEAHETAQLVQAEGRRAILCRADVANDAAVREMVAQVTTVLGRLDVLINNAGTTHFIQHADLEAVSDKTWDQILAVNVKGAFFCMRAAAEPMRRQGAGAVVNVSSVAGLKGSGSSIPYAASKGALNTLTLSMARVLAPQIRVNCVCPGFIEGRWLRGGLADNYETAREQASRRAPLQGVATPERVASVIAALVRDMNWVTGQIIAVDGGTTNLG